MKIIAINGSPRSGGNTSILLNWATEELQKEGLEVETVRLGGQNVPGCKACGACFKNQNRRCIQDQDPVNELIAKLIEADGLILGSPVYFADLTPELKAFIDRAGLVAVANDRFLERKAGAAAVVARRGGQVHTYDSINHFFGIMGMFTVGSIYCNMGVALEPGQVREDEEAEKTMRKVGVNLAWLLKKICHS
ncbi:MAG: FMN reductase [Candidatus Adiutrix intracellularis]|jgi:multimeric flavodoxin WrbA|nr:MAG: FMN reductase [Candidatus Adiutrix intracellularis]MDR2827294.1 flavodoxin family protein [Candidatus Adiutrix intracellularis]